MSFVTHPLASITLEQATALQFRIVDTVTRYFSGSEVLTMGDLGLAAGLNKPATTQKVEQVFAQVFDAQAALLVRGSGTGALRWALAAAIQPGGTLLVHDAPLYPTTQVTAQTMGLRVLRADFNDPQALDRAARQHRDQIAGVLVQQTRQKIDDSYDFCQVIARLRKLLPGAPIITDDNYAALKVEKIGCQAGAQLSSFSCFKILGPEGVGVLLGDRQYIDTAAGYQYSGGSQVQGHEAMAALRGLVYAPVALAIQSQVGEELVRRLNAGEVPGVKGAFLANAQSKVLLVELEEDCAEELLRITPTLGAAAHPVGSESIYEFVPMMYRVSGTFRAQDPTLEKRMVRINPMRGGPDTIIRILRQGLEKIGR